MRELKFRAWDKDLCKYLEGCEIGSLMAEFDAEGEGRGVIIKQICPARYRFEQYTGLKDKNGTEIYENDVVQIPGERALIVFDEKLASYMGCFSVKYRNQKVKTNDYIFAFCPDDIEVIGNIHEDPELLGGKEL